MALTGAQEGKLDSAWQYMVCRFVTFTAYNLVNIGSFADGVYTFVDMVNVHPRHSWVANSATIVLDGTDSIQRGGAASTNHVFTKAAGSGTLTDNGDGTADYTAPGSGTGTATIKCVTDGNTDDNYSYVAYGDLNLNVGAVTGFHADIGTGGWSMTVEAFGDCTGLERQKGILLVVNDYWNGSEDTFGGYKWADGVFYGYVDRVRTIRQDGDLAVLEITIKSPALLLEHSRVCDLYFVKVDTADDNIVVADFEVMDAIWWIMTQSAYNLRHNVYISDDDNSVANLKLSTGPIFAVCQDIAARCFYVGFDSKLGDTYFVGDPDIRYSNYFTGIDSEFTINENTYESIEIQWEDIANPLGDPPSPTDPTIDEVILTAIEADLDELVSTYPAAVVTTGGKRIEIGGLICETQATLDTWAQNYWYKAQPEIRGTMTAFLMHHVDLYTPLVWDPTIRAADLSNTGLGTPRNSDVYVTGIDYDIDVGMGQWRGSVQIVSRA